MTHQSPSATQGTSHPMRAAMERKDHAAIVNLLAPDVVLHSPIVGRRRFEGRAAVAELFDVLLAHYDGWQCLDEASGGNVHVLVTRVRVRDSVIELTDVLRHDPQGLICEIRVTARPLSGIATLAAVLGSDLAARRSRWRGVAMRVVSAPLPPLLRFGERLGAHLSMS